MNRIAPSGASSRCERCGEQPPISGGTWCRQCALQWQRDPGEEPKGYTGWVEDRCPHWEKDIPVRYHGATLADLPESLGEAFLALSSDRGLFLWGPPGCGKTHAMCAFAKHLWTQGWEFRRITYEQLCLEVRATFNAGDGRSELAVLKPLWEAPVLFVEDVGVTVSLGQQESDFSLRTFETLLDKRLEWCRATFVTSNKSVEEIGASFDARVASRLHEACEVIQVLGTDKRQAPRL
jgi:DNA polymerase III delta prime subunit